MQGLKMMCKLLVGVNDKKNNKNFEEYLMAQKSEFFTEKDGIGALVMDFEGNIQVKRVLDIKDYWKVFEMVSSNLANTKLVSIHSRTATSGLVNKDNVHFFEDKGYYFAHNGFVKDFKRSEGAGLSLSWASTFLPYDLKVCKGCDSAKFGVCRKHKKAIEKEEKDNPVCDSLQFLQKLDKPIKDINYLDKEMELKQFFGLGFLLGDKLKDAWLLVDKEITAQVGEDFTMFYSYEPSKTYKVSEEEIIRGVSLVKKVEIPLPLEHRRAFRGAYRLAL